jgi:hypothetical protein
VAYKINPDIAAKSQVVGVVKATETIIDRGIVHNFAVVERVTWPQIIIENVATNNAYQGAYNIENALEIIHDSYREMP